jgi:hypothetical protein
MKIKGQHPGKGSINDPLLQDRKTADVPGQGIDENLNVAAKPVPKAARPGPGFVQLPSNVIRKEGAASFEKAVEEQRDPLGITDMVLMALPDDEDEATAPFRVANPRTLGGLHRRPPISDPVVVKPKGPAPGGAAETLQQQQRASGERPTISDEVQQLNPHGRLDFPAQVQEATTSGRAAIPDVVQEKRPEPSRIAYPHPVQEATAGRSGGIDETVQEKKPQPSRILYPFTVQQVVDTGRRPTIQDEVQEKRPAPSRIANPRTVEQMTAQGQGGIDETIEDVRPGPYRVTDPRIQQVKTEENRGADKSNDRAP